MTEQDLSATTVDEMTSLTGGAPIAILAGSGVSIWHPTELPTGAQFTQGVFDALFRTPGIRGVPRDDENLLESWFNTGLAGPPSEPGLTFPSVPFEVMMERATRHDELAGLISRTYESSLANPVHDALAELASTGRAHALITTNYDRGIDTAIKRASAPLVRVVRETDSPLDDRAYFKIHGSAGLGDEGTLVYRLKAEGALPPWKRALLERLVHGRVLLIVGYSGLDFDICPVLAQAEPRRVLWNFRSREDASRSPGLQRMLAAGVKTVQLLGDMRRLLQLLCSRPVDADRGLVRHTVADDIRSRYSDTELLLWRSRVLNSMGHARLARDSVAGLHGHPSLEFEIRQTHAQALFHGGAYRSSCDCFLSASSMAPDDRARRLSLLDAADAARCHGSPRRAAKLIHAANDGIPSTAPWASELEGAGDLKRILLHRDRYEFVRLLPVPALAERIRREAEPLFERVAVKSLEHGRWFDFQQVAFWASRMGIALDHVNPSGHYAPPPAREGYRQLGYPVGAAMESCERAKRGEARIEELEWMFALMQDFGANPQAWKVGRAMARSFPAVAASHIRAQTKAFLRCEYTLANRAFWLIRGT